MLLQSHRLLWNNRRMPRLYVLLAALCFGTTGTAQALGPDGTSAIAVGAARVAAGAALLLLVQHLATRARERDRAATTRAAAAPPLAWPRRPVVLGALGVAGYQLCFFAAVKTTGVAVGTVVALGSAPALAGLGAWLIARAETPQRAWFLATALAVAGVALLAADAG